MKPINHTANVTQALRTPCKVCSQKPEMAKCFVLSTVDIFAIRLHRHSVYIQKLFLIDLQTSWPIIHVISVTSLPSIFLSDLSNSLNFFFIYCDVTEWTRITKSEFVRQLMSSHCVQWEFSVNENCYLSTTF